MTPRAHHPDGRPALRQEPFPPQPVCWATLTEHDAEEQLVDLAEWVDWLSDRYDLDHRSIPTCWPQHGAHLEELSALRTAWLTAYAATAHADQPLDWHTQFAAARQRLTDWTARTGCRPGEHRET